MKVNEFLQIKDEEELIKIASIRKIVSPQDNIGKYKCKPFMEMEFTKVNEIKSWFLECNIIDLVCNILECSQKYLLKRDYKELIYFLKFLDNELNNIIKLENRLREQDFDEDIISSKLKACDSDELEIFGVINVVDSLANGDVLKWEKIEKLKYSVVYIKLLKNKLDARVKRKYEQLLVEESQQKNKPNG